MAWTRYFLVALALLICPIAAHSQAGVSDRDPQQVELRARKIGNAIRCVVCQNQPIEASNAPLAADMRHLVRERVAAGDTDEEVMDYLVERYGTFVLLKPPLQWDTLFLWYGPLLFLICGALGWYAYSRRVSSQPIEPEPLSPDEQDLLRTRLDGTPRP